MDAPAQTFAPYAQSFCQPRLLLLLPLLLAVTALAMGYRLLPFYGAIMWATITALLFVPVYRRPLPRGKGRRNTAAAWAMLIVLLGCVLPFAPVTAALAREASVIYQHIDPGEWRPGLYLRGLFAPRCTRSAATLSDPPSHPSACSARVPGVALTLNSTSPTCMLAPSRRAAQTVDQPAFADAQDPPFVGLQRAQRQAQAAAGQRRGDCRGGHGPGCRWVGVDVCAG